MNDLSDKGNPKMVEVKNCINSIKDKNLPIALNTLLFNCIDSGKDGSWSYFDELSHRLNGKCQGDSLTDEEIMNTIKIFLDYKDKI